MPAGGMYSGGVPGGPTGPGAPMGPGGPPGPPGGPFGPPPPPRPKRLGLFSSPTALHTAALNATGVGAGYLRIKQWPFFAVALAVTLGLLVTAAFLGAADNLLLWAPVLLAWFLAAAAHGLFAGRAHDERVLAQGGTPPRSAVPYLTAGGLAVALVVSLTAVWQLGEWRLRVADASHARGECGNSEAVAEYESVEDFFQLSFSSSLMERARAGIAACRLLEQAQEDVAAEDYGRALDSYAVYFEHPAARWQDTDGEVADIHFSYATDLLENADAALAGEVTPEYTDDVLRAHEIFAIIPVDYEGTAAAGRVPEALVGLYETGTNRLGSEWCVGLDQIDVLRDLDWSAAPEIPDRIEEERPEAALECGWESVEAQEFDQADEMVEILESQYADYEAGDVETMVTHIGAGRIEQEMDLMTAIGESDLDASPTGGSGNDKFVFEIVNHSPYELRFLYVGPDKVHGEVTAAPCEDCDTYAPGSPPSYDACFGDGETLKVELEPGEYRIVIANSDSLFTRPMHGTVDLSGGDLSESCYYVTTGE
ncbi:DUF1109 domain-containing protein [Nocardiopsis changdeensis]|uniref:DUF1109 domain-containing protein n=1 Tax=Nocardiopsis changdeensis TaxID=2831969 RepID=UPI003F45C456